MYNRRRRNTTICCRSERHPLSQHPAIGRELFVDNLGYRLMVHRINPVLPNMLSTWDYRKTMLYRGALGRCDRSSTWMRPHQHSAERRSHKSAIGATVSLLRHLTPAQLYCSHERLKPLTKGTRSCRGLASSSRRPNENHARRYSVKPEE